MRIATAAYPLDILSSWAHYEDKLAAWVASAAASGAELLVFPEYGAMELATLAGLDVAGNLEASLFAVSDRLADADAAHKTLAAEYNVHIVAASGPAATQGRPVNRARLITPTGRIGVQDNQCVTAMSSCVGPADWSDALGQSFGAGGIFCPPDIGFPSTGVLAATEINVAGWAYADVDLKQIAKVREDGVVLNRNHWSDQFGRDQDAINVSLL